MRAVSYKNEEELYEWMLAVAGSDCLWCTVTQWSMMTCDVQCHSGVLVPVAEWWSCWCAVCCRHCRVFTHISDVTKPRWWYSSVDTSCGSAVDQSTTQVWHYSLILCKLLSYWLHCSLVVIYSSGPLLCSHFFLGFSFICNSPPQWPCQPLPCISVDN